MSIYKTKQRRLLSDFFKNNPHKIFTATSIVEYFEQNHDVSASTIYRHLAALVDSGEIRQVIHLNGREESYQYIDNECCKNQIHLLCRECHESMHMDSDIAATFKESLLRLSNFKVDTNTTIIYGVCKNCR